MWGGICGHLNGTEEQGMAGRRRRDMVGFGRTSRTKVLRAEGESHRNREGKKTELEKEPRDTSEAKELGSTNPVLSRKGI